MSPIPAPRAAATHAHKLKIPAPPKTLTPKRKHRKMLKDGSSEVWPEDVERVFVEGLRQYWKSPYATFSSGRSRWRNAYLVEYLQKAGITRTKKQVASHIQVLRNMWKGETEYSLVAAADEEQALNPPASPTTDDEDSDAASASPLTPSGSPFEDAFGAAHSTHAYAGHHAPAGASSLRVVTSLPVRVKTEDAVPDLMAVPYSHGLHPSYAVPRSFAHAPMASSSYSDRGMVLAPDLIPSSSYQTTPVANDTGSSLFPPQSYFRPRSSPSSAATPPITAPAPVHSQPNRFVGFNVWSDHALICSLAPQTVGDTVRAAFQVSLQLPGPMNIVPAVTVAARWSQAICTTVVMHGGEIKYQTSAHIPPPQLSDPSAPIVACLPDPWLPVSQWMDYQPMCVSQRLTIDGAFIALAEYSITLSPDAGATGQAYNIRGYAADGSPRWSPVPMPPAALHGSAEGTAPRLACAPPRFDAGYQSASPVSAISGLSAFGPFC